MYTHKCPLELDVVIYLISRKGGYIMATYQKRIPFTPEQMELLMCNSYTAKVTPHRILFTLEFKEFAMQEVEVPGMTYRKIFQKAGYDTELLGHERMKHIMRSIKLEAASEEGLRVPKAGIREEELAKRRKEDLSKKHTKTAIKELQDRVNHLEQQIDFLKKLSQLNKKT